MPVCPTSLEPADFIGRLDPVRGTFGPEPFGLAEVLLTAHLVDHPILVVLEGVNRAPVESALLPFVDLFIEAGSRNLRLIHPGVIDANDPFACLADVRWPRNVLLAAITVDGAATLPLGASWAPSCCVIDGIDQTARPSDSGASETSWVSNETWNDARLKLGKRVPVDEGGGIFGIASEDIPKGYCLGRCASCRCDQSPAEASRPTIRCLTHLFRG